jgi:hypothetical protein
MTVTPELDRRFRDAAARAGLAVEGWRTENYFGASVAARTYAVAGRALPPRLRHGITMWLRRPAPARA